MICEQVGYNDGVLLVSLLYLGYDLASEWELFSTCARPIHWWLLVSYSSVVLFRITHLLGVNTTSAGAGHFLLDRRQKETVPRLLAAFTWLVAMPAFVAWTAIGTHWIYEVLNKTPQCVPTDSHLWFTVLWMALSYVWIFIHLALAAMAWRLESRVRRAEIDLREIEDEEMVSRWGQVSDLQGYQSLPVTQGVGLTVAELGALPCATAWIKTDDDNECPICLTELCTGDKVRSLGSCGHTFHRACIDLWLLRRADCPLCKRDARPKA